MAIDTLRGMRVFVDEQGEYHFLTHGAQLPSAGWVYIGVMYPHMQEIAEGDNPVAPPQKNT